MLTQYEYVHVASSTHHCVAVLRDWRNSIWLKMTMSCCRLISLVLLIHSRDFSPAQSLFLLPEVDAVRGLPANPLVAVEISDGTLVWEGGGPSTQTSPSARASAGQRRHLDRYPHPPAPCPGGQRAPCS